MDRIDPLLKNNFSYAEKLFSKGEYYEAIIKYKEILINHPQLLGAMNNIGLSYECMNELDKALIYYEKCSKIHPKEIIFINNMINIYFKLKDYKNTIKFSNNSLLIDSLQVKIIEAKAISLIKLNLIKEADLFLNQNVKNFPNNFSLNTLYGKNLLNLNNHKLGLKYLKKGTGFIELNEDKINIIQ